MISAGRLASVALCTAALLLLAADMASARGGRRGGKGKGKSNLQFAQVAEFSLIQTTLADNRVSKIGAI